MHADNCLCVSQDGLGARLEDAGDDEIAVEQPGHFPHPLAVELRIGDFHGDAVGVVGLDDMLPVQALVFLDRVDTKDAAQQDQREDQADDAQRISHGIAQGDGRLRLAYSVEIGLLGGTQSRSIGHGARHHTGERDQASAAHHGDQAGDQDADQDDAYGEGVQPQAVLLERSEEARTDLHADGVDEEDEAEVLDEIQHRGIDAHAEMTEGDADEKNPGDTQGDAADLDLAQQSAEGDGGGQDEYAVGSAAAEE